MGRLAKRGILVAFFGLALVLSTFIIAAGPAAAIHWCQPLGFQISPTSGYTGDRPPFTFTLTNNIDDALNVREVDVKFDFDPTTWNVGSISLPGHGSGTLPSGNSALYEPLPATPGNYPVHVTVSGQAVGDLFTQNCYLDRVVVVIALPPAPTVIMTANPTTGSAPLTVSFSATVSNGLGPFTYSWTFGDGAICLIPEGCPSPSSVSHTYNSAGTYTAKVIVTDSRSRSASDSVTVTVSQAPPSAGGGGSGSGGGGSNSPGSGGGIDFSSLGPLVAIVLVVVVAIAGVAFALSRRRKPGPPTQPPSGPQ